MIFFDFDDPFYAKNAVWPCDRAGYVIPPEVFTSLRAGQQGWDSTGYYRAPTCRVSERLSLEMATKFEPRGVICFLSALRFHGLCLTTSKIRSVPYMALPRRIARIMYDLRPLDVFNFSPESFEFGIECHVIRGHPVRIYSVAKSVADCFKFRNHFGTDLAVNALREAWRNRLCSMDELIAAAKICRQLNVMKPYLGDLFFHEQSHDGAIEIEVTYSEGGFQPT